MKTISLEEAKKLATPGKVHVNRDKNRKDGLDELVYNDKQGRECFIALVHVRSPKTLAPLLAHRWNTHDELVEALEYAMQYVDHSHVHGVVEAVLARAKTVEMP